MKKVSDIFREHMCIILGEMCNRVGADVNNLDMDKFQSGADQKSRADKPLFCDEFSWTPEDCDSFRDWWIDYLYKSAPARKELYGSCRKNKRYLLERCWPWWMLQFCWRFKK